MPIPALDERGFLPPGVHVATWTELTASRFATATPRRVDLTDRLSAYLERLRGEFKEAPRVWIDGKFLSDKQMPGDVDLIVDVTQLTRGQAGPSSELQLLLNPEAMKAQYEVHVFPYLSGDPRVGRFNDNGGVDRLTFFQRIKQEDLVERSLPEGAAKGIVELKW